MRNKSKTSLEIDKNKSFLNYSKDAVGLIMFCLIAMFLFNTTVAHAEATIINDSSKVTFTDSSGKVVKGAIPNLKNLIPIAYYGTNLLSDMTVQTGSSQPVRPETGGRTSFTVQQNQLVRVNNARYYKGNPITLAFRMTSGNFVCYTTNNKLSFAPTGLNASFPVYEFWLEDDNGNKILDNNVRFLLAQNINCTTLSSRYLQIGWTNPNGIDNMIVQQNSSTGLTFAEVDFLSNGLNILNRSYTYLTLNYSAIFKQSEDPLVLTAGFYTGTYPDGIPFVSQSLTMNSLSFFDTTIPYNIALLNPSVEINNTYNKDTFKAKMDLTQALYKQSTDSFYSDLIIHVDLPDILDAQNVLDKLVIKDKLGNDISSKVTKSYNSTSKKIELVLSKSLLQSLGNNSLNITADVALPDKFDELKQYYSSSTQNFVYPITADNSDNLNDDTKLPVTVSGNMTVKAPAPTADPIEQTVYQGTSTKKLNAKDFVKNLQSKFTDDSVSVVGFKEQKEFTTLGNDSAIVVVKSSLTGATAEISVPVNVVESPKENAQLVWQPTEARSKEKWQTIDKSTMTETAVQQIAWSTSIPNQNYIISVRDSSGNEITSKALETNGTVIDKKIETSFDLPTSQLA